MIPLEHVDGTKFFQIELIELLGIKIINNKVMMKK